jgi:hypothetical protein
MQSHLDELQNLFLENKAYATPMIIAFRNDITDFTFITGLKNMIAAYEKSQTHQTDKSHFYIDKKEFEIERELWRNRALLYQNFLSLSKQIQEKEYYEVLDWYKKEYEILPIWYKRIGHLIKVLTGKRTMQSLFSNKVKKYK